MKKSAYIIWVIFLALVISPTIAFTQDFTISRFYSDITVYEDSSFQVKEVINVDFLTPKYGIYREIPFRYKDELGNTITTPLKVIFVTNGAGMKWKYRVARKDDVILIKIGDAKKYISGI